MSSDSSSSPLSNFLSRLSDVFGQSSSQLLDARTAALKLIAPHLFNHTPYTITPSTLPLHSLIDHTILKPESRWCDIQSVANEAIQHHFATVCVNGGRLNQLKQYLQTQKKNSSYQPGITCVIGFPLGAMDSLSKSSECSTLLQLGADEIDMVVNVGAIKEGDYETVIHDIQTVAEVVKNHKELRSKQSPSSRPVLLKVILETCLLNEFEIFAGCIICLLCGVDFVKTSTGFSSGGATAAAVRLMKQVVGDAAQVKASGGIRDQATAVLMVQNGATRLGCSASVAICSGQTASGSGKY